MLISPFGGGSQWYDMAYKADRNYAFKCSSLWRPFKFLCRTWWSGVFIWSLWSLKSIIVLHCHDIRILKYILLQAFRLYRVVICLYLEKILVNIEFFTHEGSEFCRILIRYVWKRVHFLSTSLDLMVQIRRLLSEK